MKRNIFSLTIMALLLGAGAFFINSCAREDEHEPTGQTAQSVPAGMIPKAGGTLGYLDESGTFQSISNDALHAFYRSILHLPDAVTFGPYGFEAQNTTGSQPRYVVRVYSTDGRYRVASTVQRYGATSYAFMQAGTTTCTCESVSCANNWGCNADVFGGNCSCTSCDGDCKKTSTASSMAAIQTFFRSY